MRITKKQLNLHTFDFGEVIDASPKPKTAQELIIEIDDLVRRAWTYLDDPENLSKIILELGIKNNGLGNHLAEVQGLEEEAKAQWKYKVDKRKLELVDEGKSATVAESRAELENFKEGQTYRQLKKAVVMMKLKQQSINQIFEGGRSRLSTIRSEMRQV